MTMILPRESIGQTQPERNPSWLVRVAIIMTLYEKALEVSWWMLCLVRSRDQNPWGLRPLGFWPWDLPRHNIHHGTSSAFSNNVPLCTTPPPPCSTPSPRYILPPVLNSFIIQQRRYGSCLPIATLHPQLLSCTWVFKYHNCTKFVWLCSKCWALSQNTE